MVFEPGDPSKRLEERKPRSTSEKWQRRSLKPPKAQIEDEIESVDSEDEEMRWYRRKKRDQVMKTEVLHESDPTTDEAHLKIKGKIETEEFEFYVDTGSKYSLLTKDDFGTLSHTKQAKIRMSPVREIRGASGADTVRPLGLLGVELRCGEVVTFVDFIVVSTLNKSILGAVKDSRSPHACPAFLVTKGTDDLRIVTDYKPLDSITILDKLQLEAQPTTLQLILRADTGRLRSRRRRGNRLHL